MAGVRYQKVEAAATLCTAGAVGMKAPVGLADLYSKACTAEKETMVFDNTCVVRNNLDDRLQAIVSGV